MINNWRFSVCFKVSRYRTSYIIHDRYCFCQYLYGTCKGMPLSYIYCSIRSALRTVILFKHIKLINEWCQNVRNCEWSIRRTCTLYNGQVVYWRLNGFITWKRRWSSKKQMTYSVLCIFNWHAAKRQVNHEFVVCWIDKIKISSLFSHWNSQTQ